MLDVFICDPLNKLQQLRHSRHSFQKGLFRSAQIIDTRNQMSRPIRVTQQSVDKHIQNQRNLDAQRRDLNAYADENAKLVSLADLQGKMEIRRRQANQQSCRSERQYQDRIEEENNHRRLVERTGYQNQAIASELNREASIEERRALEIQRICESSEELKELEHNLKIAYLNKDRAAQYDEKMYRSGREQDRIDEMEDQMERDRRRAVRAEGEKEGARKAKFTEQRCILQRQMREKEEAQTEAKKQTAVDKNMVDLIVNKINQEDENEYYKRKDMQAKTAKMVREYEDQRQNEILAAKMAAKAEDDRMLSYNKTVMARSEGALAKKQAKKEEEDRILQKIVEEVAHKKREEEEFNELRDMLWEEELEEKRAREQRGKNNRQAEMRRDMMSANSHMLSNKAQMRHEEIENEARIVSSMRRKFAEDEAKERILEERRRQDKLEHKTLIEHQRMEKRNMYDEERARELEISAEDARKEEYKKRVIQEARKRLLEEHASKLQGYLPGKAFVDTDEFQRYQQQQSNPQSRGGNYSR